MAELGGYGLNQITPEFLNLVTNPLNRQRNLQQA
jgi:hypothetical protein